MLYRPFLLKLCKLFITLVGAFLVVESCIASDPSAHQRAYSEAISTLNRATDEYSRWCALNAAAKESFDAGHYDEAGRYAEELQKLALKYKNDWNYGNAIQDFNLVLGRIALKSGDVAAAKKHLIAAGHSPGSPQLDSFGPNLTLASELLRKGERTAVLEYLELCKNFWARRPDTNQLDKRNKEMLDRWKGQIQNGQTPDFGGNLQY
jgi:hypothetical protein